MDLRDRELAAVGETTAGEVRARRWQGIDDTGRAIGQRVDEGERSTRLEPAADETEEVREVRSRGRGSARSPRTDRRPGDRARPRHRGHGGGRAVRGRRADPGHGRAAPRPRRTSTVRRARRGASTTSLSRRRARRSHRATAGRRATASPCRGRPPRPCRRSVRGRSDRGGGTSRRTRARGPRSRRPSRGRARRCGRRGCWRRTRRGIRRRDRRDRLAAAPARALPRSAIPARSRVRRNGLSPAFPTQSGHSWAQPSTSSGPRTVWRVPHHRQSNVARNGTPLT